VVAPVKIDERTGEVRARAELRRHWLTRRWRVTERRVERPPRRDSRFETRRFAWKWRTFSPRNIGVLYLYALIWAVFSWRVPATWFEWLTHRSVLNQNAVLIVVALGLLVPLAAGVFDLSIGACASASAVTVAWAVSSNQQGWNIWVGIALALTVGLVVGAVNGWLVVKLGVDSFIATLGMSSVLSAYAVWRSNNQSILGLPPSFSSLTSQWFWGINKTVWYALGLAFVLWYVLEHTAVGRYLLATGGGRDAARLAGVQTDRYVFGSLMVSALMASLGGVLLASQFASVQSTVGMPYLLQAFAAAFLGSTQFKGRFNVWGTVAAVFVLQSGVKGLQLTGIAQQWVQDLFFGIALIVAVAFSTFRRKVYGGQRRWWRRTESGPEHFLGRVLGWGRPRSAASQQNAGEWWFDPEDREGHHLKP
jgi:ribose transport system permease protein